MPQVLTEGRRPGEAIMSEAEFHRSRDNVTIAFSQTIEPNSLLGQVAVPADVVATPSAAAGNTGNATIAMGAQAVTSKVKDGRYKGIATDATHVHWEDPDGNEIGTSTHGAAFSKGGVKFTITAGGVANVAGDEYYVDVAADGEDFQYVAYNPAGVDGSEVPVAYSIYGTTTPADKTASLAAITRSAQINGNCVAWPAGITSAQKANAAQALAKTGIIVRN
ncbi:MAG: head decoration protein [Mesorhizobium sp.]|uniref:head decoration protein n=1 Tax=Mesorhizobium sp. TaxID=1871066 RepID=UPI0012236EF1|nr:head decoration protein [Mesorhizobium sp.]TIR24024.1 MAG: head decoration protein [Mesorhizobium sp.]